MKKYFSKFELVLWISSLTLIVVSFFVAQSTDYLTLIASIVGATSLIFCAKGNPTGQVLMILFSILYGVISWEFRYYGEVATYVGMTLPMSVIALISWIKNPYQGQKNQVKIAKITKKDWLVCFSVTAVVTIVFYFILSAFNTENLIFSTISVATSFVAVFLTYKRSAYFAIAYAVNDVVLITLWIFATTKDVGYVSVVVCFLVFLANDIYGFISWTKTQRAQSQTN